jgi:DNA-binding SARP family transcriptional activator
MGLPDASDMTGARRATDGPGRAELVIPAKVRVPPSDALPRERLETLLATIWRFRLGLVVAPAGSGKTTLLARFAAGAGVPVAWYRAETWDADEPAVLRHLEAALAAALPRLGGGWGSVEEAAAALEGWSGGPALLVVDDAHALEATPAERALGRFVEYAPRWLAIAIGTRVAPAINLSRLRVAGDLLEIGQDALRFRAWEVERLFRDFYREPVPPTDLAILARRTEGWAAGLQLFHLATRGRSIEERRRILTAAGSSSRLVREYLTWNVMRALPDELRDFLVATCVLGRLTGPLCDRLLGRTGSAALLEELLRRQIFTVEVDEADGSYRYHEVLRSHLDRMLVEAIGESAARESHRRAGVLLDEAGASEEALAAYARAEDWPAVRRLLGGAGERLAGDAPAWLDSLPAAVVRHEPWLELAVARRLRAEGRWSEAIDAYARAEVAFGASSTSLVARRERLAVRAWLDPVATAPTDWTRVLRAGIAREPLAAAREVASSADASSGLCRGLLLLAAGDVAVARRELLAAAAEPALDPVLATAARLAGGVAAELEGDASGLAEIEAAVEAAERLGSPWLARLARALAGLAPDRRAGAGADAATFDAGDPWGPALVRLALAWSPGPIGPDGRTEAAAQAADAFHRLGGGVLEAWARALAALGAAESGGPDTREALLASERSARSSGAPGIRLVAYLGLAVAEPDRAPEFGELAAAVARETGLVPPPSATRASRSAGQPALPSVHGANPAGTGTTVDDAGHPGRPLRVRTLGGFAIELDGRALPLDDVKPRARAVLRLLAAHGGQPVHREVIAEALWPASINGAGARSLHVAVSSLRGLFVAALGSDGARLLVREGEAYRLAVPGGAIDIGRFERAALEARDARADGRDGLEALEHALDAYGGDLLPEDGPAEWIVDRRERLRALALDVARELAIASLTEDEADRAIRACQVGLRIDRYHDPLWRLLIQARDRAGDVGAANRDRREYQAMLAALGVTGTAVSSV